MKIKVSELIDDALNWAVCRARYPEADMSATHVWLYTGDGEDDFLIEKTSTDWSQGGLIIDQEKISVIHMEGTQHWVARKFQPTCDTTPKSEGPTLLIAAMRCYVASKLGDEVDVPEDRNCYRI